MRAERRAFLGRLARTAGVVPAIAAWIGGAARARPAGEETDLAILDAALMLEHHAIALYDHGLRNGLVPHGLRDYAIEFRGDHHGHRDTQVAIIEERGGRPPVPLPRYDFAGTRAGDAFVREALEIEVAAQDAYTTLISGIRTDDYLLSAGFILIDEVRHVTVWRRALGLGIY